MAEGDYEVAKELAEQFGLEISSPRMTDWGNAQRLVTLFGSELRYCHPWQKWLVWYGRRWAIDETGAAVRKVKETILAMHGEADNADDEEFKSKLAKWATRTESEARIKATLSLAKSEEVVPVLPDQLDSNPWLLNVLNGTLDLRSGKLREPQPEDLITKLAPVFYEPTASCPLCGNFLNVSWQGMKGC